MLQIYIKQIIALVIMEKDGGKQMPFRISCSNIMYFDFIFDPLLPSSPPTYITYMLNTIMGQAF